MSPHHSFQSTRQTRKSLADPEPERVSSVQRNCTDVGPESSRECVWWLEPSSSRLRNVWKIFQLKFSLRIVAQSSPSRKGSSSWRHKITKTFLLKWVRKLCLMISIFCVISHTSELCNEIFWRQRYCGCVLSGFRAIILSLNRFLI